MHEDLRIVFMGTPDFAVATLKKLVENNYNIVGVITAPDRPAGRGQKLQQSAVKNYALEKNLHVMQPTNLKSEQFLEELKSLNANLQVVVAFRMLPKAVWQMPKLGTFNLHASLLPDYRGAAPIHWAIINGEKKSGVTTFFIDDKIDTGEIILSKTIEIGKTTTVGELHDKMMELGGELVIETVDLIKNGNIKTEKQPESEQLKTANKLTKENTKIDWSLPVESIFNKIRGLNPYPAAWSVLLTNDTEYLVKLYDVDFESTEHPKPVGTIIIEGNSMKVSAKDGFILVNELQLQGKRKMDIKSFLNGFSFSKDAKML